MARTKRDYNYREFKREASIIRKLQRRAFRATASQLMREERFDLLSSPVKTGGWETW